ncbi:MAG TPA: hypothetical protein VFJ48_07065, partial [Casimicrobiaceae bacterium]|nr:hypothetical protein [Casimicrobiaceae bacterium]
MNQDSDTTDRIRPARPARKSRLKRWLLIAIVLVVVAGAAGVAFVASELAVATAARILISRSEGRLSIEGASGSLLSLVRIKHL